MKTEDSAPAETANKDRIKSIRKEKRKKLKIYLNRLKGKCRNEGKGYQKRKELASSIKLKKKQYHLFC